MHIAITSNLKKYYKGYIDFIDHYWLNFFESQKIIYSLIPNKPYLSAKKFSLLNKKIDLLILTGGSDVKGKKKDTIIRNKIEKNLKKISLKKKIPILGICRGAQLINIFFGGKINNAQGHMRSRHNVWFKNTEVIKSKVLNVNSFHNSLIKKKNLTTNAKEIAIDSKKNVEMFHIKTNKIIGVMWHPEREKNNKFLKNLIVFLTKKK